MSPGSPGLPVIPPSLCLRLQFSWLCSWKDLSPQPRLSPPFLLCWQSQESIWATGCTLPCTVQLIRKYITSSLLLKLLVEDISNYPDTLLQKCGISGIYSNFFIKIYVSKKHLQFFNKYQNIFFTFYKYFHPVKVYWYPHLPTSNPCDLNNLFHSQNSSSHHHPWAENSSAY